MLNSGCGRMTGFSNEEVDYSSFYYCLLFDDTITIGCIIVTTSCHYFLF